MAMLTKNTNEILKIGNEHDVCMICASNKKISISEAKKVLKGKLEGKIILRIDNEKNICSDCLQELSDKAQEVIGNSLKFNGEVDL